MISYKSSPDIEFDGTENCARMQLFADTSTELTGVTHFDGIRLVQGSAAYVISSGEKWMLDGSGSWIPQPSDNAWQNVYTKAEIDSMITEIYDIIAYYHTTLVSDTGEITFYSLGGNVGTWAIYGNGQQTGTPTPTAPITPDFVGTLSDADWMIPITCAGQTVPVYLGEVPTVRRVKKLVLDGTENIGTRSGNARFYIPIPDMREPPNFSTVLWWCSHYVAIPNDASWTSYDYMISWSTRDTGEMIGLRIRDINYSSSSVSDFKAYLASEYAAGHPVTIWYVLTNEETGIVNDPLAKIGDYADELHSTDAGVTIPTVNGQNTLTVETPLPPSKIIISGE